MSRLDGVRGKVPQVLMVSMWYPPCPGGLPRQAHLLTRTLMSMGTPVNVVTMYEAGIRGREIREGVPVYRLPTFESGGNRRRAYPWLVSLGAFLVAHKHQYDIIHVHQALHAAALSVGVARLLGKKCLVKVAGSGEAGNIEVLKSWKYSGPISLRLLRRADRLISLSPEITAELRASGFDPSAIVEIPNGVDIERFQNATPVPGMSRSVIVPARLAREKALDVLIRAWAATRQHAPGWRIAILGDGPERGALEAMARELGLGDSVWFLGDVPDVSGYLAASKVFVLPSRHGEGMSSAVLEGLVAGCACLTSDITANAQLIDHGVTGLLFRNEDVLDLSSKLGTLLEDHALRRRLGEAAARAGAERYSIGGVARQYQTLYLQVLSE